MSIKWFQNKPLAASALVAGLALAGPSAMALDLDGPASDVAPFPLLQPHSPLLLKANAESFAAASTTLAISTGLMSQPLMLMSAAPQADPQIVEKILSMPSQAASLASTVSLIDATATASAPPVMVMAKPQAPAAGTAAHGDNKLELYTRLMALNGTTTNVRMILKNAKESIRLVVIERAGTVSLTPEQELRYEEVASNILQETEAALLNEIASTQSQAFSEAEIHELIRANSTPAAQKYNAAKYVAPAEAVTQVQAYMVDAVYKILKNFKQVIAS